MKYFFDTEFIEGFHTPLFGKKRHFIDLISIGIVCEDGRTYKAISNEYNYHDADDWVKTNVIIPLYIQTVHGDARNHIDADVFQKTFGKSRKVIAQEIKDFVYPIKQMAEYYYVATGDHPDIVGTDKLTISDKKGRLTFSIFDKELEPELNAFKPEFYAYYADYDWVLFCSLFGRMIDLPKGFPMYCVDLKQSLDDKVRSLPLTNFEDDLARAKVSKRYPVQKDEHDALADAKWNFELFKYLNPKYISS